MYLMNVPPVAATPTEWRACGPPGGYSLPIGFNDSDAELSTRGTPISDKVQMIIESLRSSQSSFEMGDEIEGNVLSGQQGHAQACKVAVGSYVGAKSKTKGPAENQQGKVSSPDKHESSDSDSDDSVDRGIEEAILEYLKEKDDHKRKADPCFSFLQSSKIPRKNPSVPEISKQNTDSNTFLIASNQLPKSIKADTPTAPAVVPLKKLIKHKDSLNDNTIRKLDGDKSTTKSLALPKEQTTSPSKTINVLNKVKCPLTFKVEEDSNDSSSSSDDGIEEAIQRYQLEKKEQQNNTAFNPHTFNEESDSTSDDGIEEAIRSYQLEQLKEKSALKAFMHKQKPFSKSLMHAVGSSSVENTKKHKLRKKKIRTVKEVKSVQSPSSVFISKDMLSDSSKGKGNGLLLFKVESTKEEPAPTPAPPKVNTTAELMCAEAILDISKTVMPGAFHQSVGLSSSVPTESSLLPDSCPAEESDASSIDSEDGIEQEIRKFLEQKAQMHKQPPNSVTTHEPPSVNEPEEVKATQKKLPRLSLTQRRKHRAESCSISNMSKTANNIKESLPEHGEESSPMVFSHRSQMHSVAGLHKGEQGGDKSSSLDSDEDLDSAIKDLLQTKKKSKKKTRNLKRKPRKGLKNEEPTLVNVLPTKKFKPDLISKRSALKKVKKGKDMKDKSGFSKMSVSQHKQSNKSEEHDVHENETEKLEATEGQVSQLLCSTENAVQINEDSSSVDSDDSIEQEIRRFLAEKAKVSTAERSKDGDVSKNGTAAVFTAREDEDIEHTEIPRKSISPLSGQSLLTSRPLPVPQSLLPDISAIGTQSLLTSVQSSRPSLLEPADGAGAARTEQRRPIAGRGDVQDAAPQMERIRPVLTPARAHSLSESIKWRQSLGLPTTDTRTLSRTPFHITSSKISKTASATPPFQSGVITPKSQTPVSVWSSARTSRAHFPCSAETAVNTAFKSPVLNLLSTARQLPRLSFTQSPAPGHRSQCPVGEAESMVHMPKDKSVFVELESNRTNHVQVRSRDWSEGKNLISERKRESKSMKIEDKDVHLERTEEECIDETDDESGDRKNPEKKQGFSTL